MFFSAGLKPGPAAPEWYGQEIFDVKNGEVVSSWVQKLQDFQIHELDISGFSYRKKRTIIVVCSWK